MTDVTRDAFLGGRVSVLQPKTGYRAGTDPVFLAAACPAKSGDTVLELGCGVGVAALCLLARVEGAKLTGVEKQASYAALARQNAQDRFNVVEADITALPAALRNQSFDHVILNPPYFPPNAGTTASDPTKEMANREDTPIATWIDIAVRRLAPRGTLTAIARTDRMVDIFHALDHRLGSISVLPLAARGQKPAKRIIIQARKGGRAAPQLLPPLILHKGQEHLEDRDNFTVEAANVLRGGAALRLDR